jgi:rhamnogalacturonyl hydrolase YesR
MQKHINIYKVVIFFFSLNLFLCCTSEKPNTIPTANEVIKLTEKVANSQMNHKITDFKANTEASKDIELSEWHGSNSLLYTGMFQLSKVSHYPKYINWLITKGEQYNWQVPDQKNKPDDYSISQFYLSIYQKPHLNRKELLIPTQTKLKVIVSKSQDKDHQWKSSEALFQKPTVLAKLSKIEKDTTYAYLEYLDTHYKNIYKDLWDKDAQLFYRDSTDVDKKEKNGNKLFSSRSNSGVFAGLAFLISDLPKDWESKTFYEDLFVEMAQTLKKTQRKDGTWSEGLLGDKAEYQNLEISGTSFFTFGIAWGITNGLLGRTTYEPVLLKAWNKIAKQVNKNGEFKLSKISDEFKEYPPNFGVGGFLAAGSEMYNYITTFYPIDKSTSYTTFMEDGGWCWYQDPRVIISNKKLIIAGLSGKSGDARLGVFDLKKEQLDSVIVLAQDIGADDHNVPALYKRPDKSVLAVWAKHAKEKIHYSSISEPTDYSKWSAIDTFKHDYKKRTGVTYMNLHYLKNQDKLYNFFRDGTNFNPTFITSTDQGETWGNRTHFISNDVEGFQRPYPRYLQVDENTVGISYTDAHPRKYGNNLYYAEFLDNNFYTVDGTFIKSLDEGPMYSSSAERIYKGSNTKKKSAVNESVPNSAWTTAIAKDKDSNPHIGYTLYLNDDDLRFRLAFWNGNTWNDREIAYAGKSLYKIESSYTGLLTFDPEDPTNVYISTDVNPSTGEDLGGNHEIYSAKIEPNDDINSIKWTAITSNSPHRNIRPIVVSDEGYKVLLWLYGPWKTFKNYDANVVGKILEKPE